MKVGIVIPAIWRAFKVFEKLLQAGHIAVLPYSEGVGDRNDFRPIIALRQPQTATQSAVSMIHTLESILIPGSGMGNYIISGRRAEGMPSSQPLQDHGACMHQRAVSVDGYSVHRKEHKVADPHRSLE
ncbi:hypothetical protein GTR04_5849 [Trichophyton interdigitale]|uniref:Uncharacterized protein n=2 Tax=Trichophyton interdigitale TaxID=101480 RepID=A0A9P4YF22_9EURO|nr:hypothetical protein GY632_3652 [Trichophyton interdigitale]KAG5209738.1 hypothetical protein GY631_5499 [Trichophyton interdigitale]KAG8206766.1 hypothetical protein GTR04_5849 [Trichophyton interdigitale]KDB20743.1 hypothetical protein H109_07304 [Trichophyton interdigitale MR816]